VVTPKAANQNQNQNLNEDARPQLAVLGLGLIGGSIALAASERGLNTWAWDPDESARVEATRHGIKVSSTLADLVVSTPQILLVAVPLRFMSEVMSEIALHISPLTTLTDVGSVKTRVREAVHSAGLNELYVGAHPMAGTERSGFAAASSDIISGATWALTLGEGTSPIRAAEVASLITGTLDGRVIALEDGMHDAAAALISHLPHVYAHSLTALVAGSPAGGIARILAAGSFRDGTRVARGNPARNAAMIADNSVAMVKLLDDALSQLSGLRSALADGDYASVEALCLAGQVDEDGSPQGDTERVRTDDVVWREKLLSAGRAGRLIRAVRWAGSDMTGPTSRTADAGEPSAQFEVDAAAVAEE